MSIQDQLKEAAENAKKTEASTAGAVVESTPSAPPAVGKRMSLSDFRNNAAGNVSTFLKVSEHGLTFGKEARKLVDSFPATIDLGKAKACIQVRYGNPAQYFKSLDGVTTQGTGKPWNATLAQAKAVEPGRSSDPYATAEIVMVTREVVKTANDKDVAAEAGVTVGYTPPYTGADAFAQLLKEVEAAGLNPESAVVNVLVGYEPQARNGNNWGIVTFKLEGPAA